MSIEWGSVADWVSGIGTVSTLVATVFLATKDSRIKGKIMVNYDRTIHCVHGEKQPNLEVCFYNSRVRPIQIKEYGIFVYSTIHKATIYRIKNDDGSVLETVEMGKVFIYKTHFDEIRSIAKNLGINDKFSLGYYAYFECFGGRRFTKRIYL